jgi:hypothetical protein
MSKFHPQSKGVAADMGLKPTLRTPGTDASVGITDTRVAQLLLVLSEIDECVAGLEHLPKTQLSELISTAILACGFTNPVEARFAIATVLRVIEAPDPPLLLAL